VQKNIVLTGHIVDHLVTIVSKATWSKLSDEDKKIFGTVAQEAAQRATAEILAKEKELIDTFKQKGLNIIEVNKDEFRDAVMKNVTFESLGYRKSDYDKIQAMKSEAM
jgi:TRAP-type C4-dicarboxylate transport system substrate-binding protein